MKLSIYLRHKNVTVTEFARRIGRHKSVVSKLASGRSKPDWETARRIREETDGNVTPNDFLDDDVIHAAE